MEWLDPDDYLEKAKALPIGSDARIEHWCGDGQVIKISHTNKGYSAYCFRCGSKGFTPIERKTLSDFDILKQEEAVAELSQTMRLPNDFTQEIPTEHALWLFRAGLHMDRIRASGFGYSSRLARVVLPVYDNGVLVYIQARATMYPEQKPKYLNIKGAAKDDIIYQCTPEQHLEGYRDTVVVTEDILSANRVGEVCNAISILGTKLSNGQALKLAKYSKVLWWLDGDDAGISGARKGSSSLQFLVGVQHIIRTPKDPKCYSSRHIRNILRNEHPEARFIRPK
jgi:DNA primase